MNILDTTFEDLGKGLDHIGDVLAKLDEVDKPLADEGKPGEDINK